jgi:hypothetical protein
MLRFLKSGRAGPQQCLRPRFRGCVVHLVRRCTWRRTPALAWAPTTTSGMVRPGRFAALTVANAGGPLPGAATLLRPLHPHLRLLTQPVRALVRDPDQPRDPARLLRHRQELAAVVSRVSCKIFDHGCGGEPLWATRSVVHKGSWQMGSGGHAQGLLLVLAQVVHVQVAVRFQPVLVHLHRQLPISRKQISALKKIRTTLVRRLTDLRQYLELAGSGLGRFKAFDPAAALLVSKM